MTGTNVTRAMLFTIAEIVTTIYNFARMSKDHTNFVRQTRITFQFFHLEMNKR